MPLSVKMQDKQTLFPRKRQCYAAFDILKYDLLQQPVLRTVIFLAIYSIDLFYTILTSCNF